MMAPLSDDAKDLLSAFDSGELVRPDPEHLNAVDFALAIASINGMANVPDSQGKREIAKLIGKPEHLIVLAIDGLGMNFVNRLPDGAFLRRKLVATMNAPFPTTTSVAFTTFATGLWPADHGITSWFVYLPEIDASTIILPFVRRADRRPLTQLGIHPKSIWRNPALLQGSKRDSIFVMPASISESEFTQYQSAGARIPAYPDMELDRGLEILVDHVARADWPTHDYLYFAKFDGLVHQMGTGHVDTINLLQRINASLERFARELQGRATVIVMADHGHLDEPSDGSIDISPDSAPGKLLRVAPSGDYRVAYFEVEEAKSEEFVRVFRREYGDWTFLLSIDEIDELRLFGPDPLAEVTRSRMGQWMAISRGARAFSYVDMPDSDRLVSGHSGLSHAEMDIPLIVF